MSRSLSNYQRITVKIGSALLVENGRLKREWLESLADDLQALSEAGKEVLVVSSGSIALAAQFLVCLLAR